MSYSIHVIGKGAPDEAVAGAFQTLVRTLREATPEGGTVEGGVKGTDDSGKTTYAGHVEDVDKPEPAPPTTEA